MSEVVPWRRCSRAAIAASAAVVASGKLAPPPPWQWPSTSPGRIYLPVGTWFASPSAAPWPASCAFDTSPTQVTRSSAVTSRPSAMTSVGVTIAPRSAAIGEPTGAENFCGAVTFLSLPNTAPRWGGDPPRSLEEARIRVVEAAHCVRVQYDAANAAIFGQHAGLRFDFLGRENSRHRREQRVAVQQFEIAGELFHAINFAAALDLYRHGSAGMIARQNIDRPNRGGEFPAYQLPAAAQSFDLLGEQFLQMRFDAVLN